MCWLSSIHRRHKSHAKGPYDPELWFKSVADIEQLTGEQFLSGLPNAAQLKQSDRNQTLAGR